MWASGDPVPGARVAANPRLLSCKYHTHRNVGGKEDLEGAHAGLAPFQYPTDDQVVQYCVSFII